MAETEAQPEQPESEELKRYRIRYGFWKVVVGSLAVTAISVIVPAAIEFSTLRVEEERKRLELEILSEQKHQEYVSEFLHTAIDQDIELRIRFAEYFANVSVDEYQDDWQDFLKRLRDIRDKNRETIHQKERELQWLLADKQPSTEIQIKIAELERELQWRYGVVGYAIAGRSIVPREGEQQLITTAAEAAKTVSNLLELSTQLEKKRESLEERIAKERQALERKTIERQNLLEEQRPAD